MTTRDFALRTDDAEWIARNNGATDQAGRVHVQVPASEVEPFTMCGKPWLRHTFADIPADALNAAICCPAVWVA